MSLDQEANDLILDTMCLRFPWGVPAYVCRNHMEIEIKNPGAWVCGMGSGRVVSMATNNMWERVKYWE